MRRLDPAIAVIVLAGGVVGFAGLLGGDLRWAAALGDVIVRVHHVPRGLPFASADSRHWHNVPVASELILSRLHRWLGDRGFVLAQVGSVVATFEILRRAMAQRGASAAGSALATAFLFVGAFPAFVIVRLQLFSLVPFALLLLVLGTRRFLGILPFLFCIWSNLHGAALIGLVVLTVYALMRARSDRMPLLVLGASTAAACVTPALWNTPAYYYDVASSVAARSGVELWAPISFTSGLDDLLLGTAVALAAATAVTRVQRWELAALVVLTVAMIHTARTGVWLLMLLAVTAAPRLSRLSRPRLRPTIAIAVAGLGAFLGVAGFIRGPLASGATPSLIARAKTIAGSTPILADGIPAEQLALSGATIWITDPLDAFPRNSQRLYLDWLEGKAGVDAVRVNAFHVVVTLRRSKTAVRLMAQREFRLCRRDARADLFVRRDVDC